MGRPGRSRLQVEIGGHKDPDGHPFEILWLPPGKGDARWHRAGDRLFLGIDHTAIVVADTDRSLGESDSHGPEQERLNNVFGVRLRITTLRAGAGPGVELLQYLTPGDGRPIPADARANDLAHWQTALTVADAAAAERALGFARAVRLGDPDGHALALREP